MAELQVGEIVRLKSGGPDMTIAGIRSSDPSECRCQWFEGSQVREGWFAVASLVKVDRAGGEPQRMGTG